MGFNLSAAHTQKYKITENLWWSCFSDFFFSWCTCYCLNDWLVEKSLPGHTASLQQLNKLLTEKGNSRNKISDVLFKLQLLAWAKEEAAVAKQAVCFLQSNIKDFTKQFGNLWINILASGSVMWRAVKRKNKRTLSIHFQITSFHIRKLILSWVHQLFPLARSVSMVNTNFLL